MIVKPDGSLHAAGRAWVSVTVRVRVKVRARVTVRVRVNIRIRRSECTTA